MTAVIGCRRLSCNAGYMKAGILRPRSPERVCWGCDKFCPADDLACGGGTIRTPHPIEMFGEEWADQQDQQCDPVATDTDLETADPTGRLIPSS